LDKKTGITTVLSSVITHRCVIAATTYFLSFSACNWLKIQAMEAKTHSLPCPNRYKTIAIKASNPCKRLT
jgi:hypothetical protein